MKITVIGANGKSGSLIAAEAAGRGHQVTAVVRDKSKLAGGKAKVLEKDVFALTYDDLSESDVIIDALGVWTPDTVIQHQTSLRHLTDLLRGKPNRLLVVGGAGSLYVNPEHMARVMDAPDFPEMFKPLASSMGKALDELRGRKDVNWTYFSPAINFVADGQRTGKYILGGEELLLNGKGESQISYADYAVAMIDVAEQGGHIRERITAVSE